MGAAEQLMADLEATGTSPETCGMMSHGMDDAPEGMDHGPAGMDHGPEGMGSEGM